MSAIDSTSGASDGSDGAVAPKPHELYRHQHHWRNAEDEFEGCKFGMWLFLSTEVLLFAGFFCAYAIFRMLYPENWHDASSYYLNWKIGAANTVVLLLSSWTVVMAIRAAQLGRRGEILVWLGITQLCAIFFLVVKLGWEYWPKIKKGELPGANFNCAPKGGEQASGVPGLMDGAVDGSIQPALNVVDHVNVAVAQHAETAAAILPVAGGGPEGEAFTPGPHDQIFLSVYWIATGTHGVHVLVGIVIFAMAMWKAWKHQFGPKNYMFLENAGLYWHIVDIIWIFLFPLMYLV